MPAPLEEQRQRGADHPQRSADPYEAGLLLLYDASGAEEDRHPCDMVERDPVLVPTEQRGERGMRAIIKSPGRRPGVIEIENSLRAMQTIVGGYIEAVPLTTDSALICNEDGIVLGLARNVDVLGLKIRGTLLIVGVDGEEFCDLSDAGIDLWMPVLRRGK